MAQARPENVLYGLSDKQVQESREKYGWNLLTPPKRPSMWKLYLEKFNDFTTKLYDDISENIKKNETIINAFVKTNEKIVSNYAAYYASTASSSSSITY